MPKWSCTYQIDPHESLSTRADVTFTFTDDSTPPQTLSHRDATSIHDISDSALAKYARDYFAVALALQPLKDAPLVRAVDLYPEAPAAPVEQKPTDEQIKAAAIRDLLVERNAHVIAEKLGVADDVSDEVKTRIADVREQVVAAINEDPDLAFSLMR